MTPRVAGSFPKTAVIVYILNIGDIGFEKSPIAITPKTNARNLPVNKRRPAGISGGL
jgi:hypothetical protein